MPAPTTTIRSAGPAPESHSALSAVSMLAASVARRGGRPSGSGTAMRGGRLKHVLMGVQAEHRRGRSTPAGPASTTPTAQ